VNDAPGFVTSRLNAALAAEAARILEEGVASAEDIDKAMVLGFHHPMGPFRLGDFNGLDTRLHILEYLTRSLGDRFSPGHTIRELVEKKELGRKTGKGYYKWK
jgi:3-hydroxybutyryl-CoA dehydrogenase